MSRFALDESVLTAIDSALAAGDSVDQILAKYSSIVTQLTENGAVILHGGPADDVDEIAAALRLLAQLCRDRFRSIAVIERSDEGGLDAREHNDALGRLIVRLNISQLVAVGHGARHVQAAAGLEGSWDGESAIVDTVEGAYAFLRDTLGKNDVVLMMGTFGDNAFELSTTTGEKA